MMLLGAFLLISKYSRPKFEEEEKSGGTRWGEGLQRGAELLGNEKEKERRREKGVDQTGKYRFKGSGIGDDTIEYANAYVKGIKGCEETLEIPYELTDENQKTKYVEVIGKNAFHRCGDQDHNGTTRSIVL